MVLGAVEGAIFGPPTLVLMAVPDALPVVLVGGVDIRGIDAVVFGIGAGGCGQFDGVGDVMFGQKLKCFTRIVRDSRVLVQECAIEVKYNEFHLKNPG